MNFRLTLALVIVMALVVSLYLFLEAHHSFDKTVGPDAPKDLVLNPAPAEVKAITYTQEGEKQVSFTHDGPTWTMTYPAQGKADTYAVGAIATALRGLTFTEKFEPEAGGARSAEETGTATPKNVVTFTGDDGKDYTLSFGKRTVSGIYMTLNGGKTIYLLSGNPLDNFDRDPQEFRDKDVASVPIESVTGLSVKHGDETVTLAKSGDKWLITKPLNARANVSVAQEMLDQLRSIRAVGFPADVVTKSMPATGLTPPLVTITATYTENGSGATTAPAPKTVTLELGYFTDPINKKQVYASIAGSPQVFTFGADSFGKLNRQLQDLRDAAVTPADVGGATQVAITPGSGSKAERIALEKKGDEWTMAMENGSVPAGSAEVSALLTNIRNLRAIHYVDNAGDLKSIGLDPPQEKIEMTVPGQSQHEVILVGKPETADKVTPVMRQGEPTVYLVPTADAEKLAPTRASLRDKVVERLPGDGIRKISVADRAGSGGDVVLERKGTGWEVTRAGKTSKADDVAVTQLLGDFTPLTAVKYVDKFDATGTPETTVTLQIESAESATQPAAAIKQTLGQVLGTAGPMPKKLFTRTLRIYKQGAGMLAVWDGGERASEFEPSPDLIAHLTTGKFEAAATQPATQAASEPAAK